MDAYTKKHLQQYAEKMVAEDEIDSFTATAKKMYAADPERINEQGWGLVLTEWLTETYHPQTAIPAEDMPDGMAELDLFEDILY